MCQKLSLTKAKRVQIVVSLEEGHIERKIEIRPSCSKTAIQLAIVKFKKFGQYID